MVNRTDRAEDTDCRHHQGQGIERLGDDEGAVENGKADLSEFGLIDDFVVIQIEFFSDGQTDFPPVRVSWTIHSETDRGKIRPAIFEKLPVYHPL